MSDDIQTILAEAQKALAQSNPAIAAKLLSDILKLDAVIETLTTTSPLSTVRLENQTSAHAFK